ncbi:MAG: hypothetical protein V9G12_01025 [Microthrixaceae bacterium]
MTPAAPPQVWGLAAIGADLDATAPGSATGSAHRERRSRRGDASPPIRHRDLGIGLQLAVMTAR